jgi:hypothetical protein
MKNYRLPLAVAAGAACLALAACQPAVTGAAGQPGASSAAPATMAAGAGAAAGQASPAPSAPGAAASTVTSRYALQPMPAGTAWVGREADGRLRARIEMYGLTPGSSHQVSIDGPAGPVTWFPLLTADASGQADAVLASAGRPGLLPAGSRLVIRLGDGGGDPAAGEPIADTGELPAIPPPAAAVPGTGFALQAVTVTAGGASLGSPAGHATISYNAAARTVTVTVTASGLTPGPHAAHIHLGSCRSQGPVKYMLPDFTADASGSITDQSRTAAGVPSAPGPGTYLNLHQGGMAQILAGGVPTLSFRPMLCTDLAGTAAAASTGYGRGAPDMTMPGGAGTGGSPAPAAPSSPAPQPTHY